MTILFNGLLLGQPSVVTTKRALSVSETTDGVLPVESVSLLSATISEAADTLSAAGTITVQVTAAITEAADTLAATGAVLVQGAAAIAESTDTLAAAGTAAGNEITGTASITEAGDTLAAVGAITAQGTAAISEAGDTLSAAGTITAQGTAAITEAGDTLSAAGAVLVTAASAMSEAADTLEAACTTTGAVTADASITEADDTLSASALISGGEIILPPPSGGVPIKPRRVRQRAPRFNVEPIKPLPPIHTVAHITEDDDGVIASGVVYGESLQAKRRRVAREFMLMH